MRSADRRAASVLATVVVSSRCRRSSHRAAAAPASAAGRPAANGSRQSDPRRQQAAEGRRQRQAQVAHHAPVPEQPRVAVPRPRHERQGRGVVDRARGPEGDQAGREPRRAGRRGDGGARRRRARSRDAQEGQRRAHGWPAGPTGMAPSPYTSIARAVDGAERRRSSAPTLPEDEQHGGEEGEQQMHEGVRRVDGREASRRARGGGVGPEVPEVTARGVRSSSGTR